MIFGKGMDEKFLENSEINLIEENFSKVFLTEKKRK